MCTVVVWATVLHKARRAQEYDRPRRAWSDRWSLPAYMNS
jgi:hypothetical protein